jgi:hypothetical protein
MAFCRKHQMKERARLTVICIFAMEATVALGKKAAITVPAAVCLFGSGILLLLVRAWPVSLSARIVVDPIGTFSLFSRNRALSNLR